MPQKTKKIIIPKGVISANETTIIEVPIDMKNKSVMIAKKGTDNKAVLSEYSNQRKTDQRPTKVIRDQQPKSTSKRVGIGHQQLDPWFVEDESDTPYPQHPPKHQDQRPAKVDRDQQTITAAKRARNRQQLDAWFVEDESDSPNLQFPKHPQRPVKDTPQYTSQHPPQQPQQLQSSGTSHASYVNYAEEQDIEHLLDDLERYYCSQRQLLLKAKLSRASICGCQSKQSHHKSTCAQTDSQTDYSDYETFQTGICIAQTSEQKPNQSKIAGANKSHHGMCCSLGCSQQGSHHGINKPTITKENKSHQEMGGCSPGCSLQESHHGISKPTITQVTKSDDFRPGMSCCQENSQRNSTPNTTKRNRSAPHSCCSVEANSTTGTGCYGKSVSTNQKPYITGSCSSICLPEAVDKQRSYGNLLTSKELFSRHAEQLRKLLNELEPGAFKSKEKFEVCAEKLRKKLKKKYNREKNALLPTCQNCEECPEVNFSNTPIVENDLVDDKLKN